MTMFEKLVNIICNYVEVEPENIHPESRSWKIWDLLPLIS